MYKTIVIVCVLCVVLIEARPRWQFLPEVPGYIPVYIRNGDTPLEEINPELAEAFHALPAGRSAGKLVEAAPDTLEPADQAKPKEIPVIVNFDTRSFDNEVLDDKKFELDAIPDQRR